MTISRFVVALYFLLSLVLGVALVVLMLTMAASRIVAIKLKMVLRPASVMALL